MRLPRKLPKGSKVNKSQTASRQPGIVKLTTRILIDNNSKIKWNLLSTFLQKKLDLDNEAEDAFEVWEHQFQSFRRASGLQDHGAWVDEEAASEPRSFRTIMSNRLQMPVGDRTNVTKVLLLIKNLCKSARNIWLCRRSFEQCQQRPDQPFRQFYAEVMDTASRCDFGAGYCTADAQRAVDDRVLSKIIFGIHSVEARQKLFEEDGVMTLAHAKKIIEDKESAMDTEKRFVGEPPTVNLMKKTFQPKKNTQVQQQRCGQCGRAPHKSGEKCPARGAICRACNQQNHFEVCCRSKGNGQGQAQHKQSQPKYNRPKGTWGKERTWDRWCVPLAQKLNV